MSFKVKFASHNARRLRCKRCSFVASKRLLLEEHQTVCNETNCDSDTASVNSVPSVKAASSDNTDACDKLGKQPVSDSTTPLTNGNAAASKTQKQSDDEEVSLKALDDVSSDATEIQSADFRLNDFVSASSAKHRFYKRRYTCKYPNCDYESVNARQFLLHESQFHQGDFNIYVCDGEGCSYSSKWLDKVLRHRISIHVDSSPWTGEFIPSPCKSADRAINEVHAEPAVRPKITLRLGRRRREHSSEAILEVLPNSSMTALTREAGSRKTKAAKKRKLEISDEEKSIYNENLELDSGAIAKSMKIVRDGKSVKFKCKLCGYMHERQHKLRAHLNLRHFSKKEFRCRHLGCEFVCSTRSEIVLHKNLHSDKTLYCSECDYTTLLQANLDRHANNHRIVNPPYKCSICTYASTREANVIRHLNEHHLSASDRQVIHIKENDVKQKTTVELKIPSYKPSAAKFSVAAPESARADDKPTFPTARTNPATLNQSVFPEAQAVFPASSVSVPASTAAESVFPLTSTSDMTSSVPGGDALPRKRGRRKSDAPIKLPSPKSNKSLVTKRKKYVHKTHRASPGENKPYTVDDTGLLCCRFCDYKANSIYTIRPHFAQHSRRRNRVYCNICAENFKKMPDLIHHMKYVHEQGDNSINDEDLNSFVVNTAVVTADDANDSPLNLSFKADASGPPGDVVVKQEINFDDELVDGAGCSLATPLMTLSNKFTDEQICCVECPFVGKYPCDLRKHMGVHDTLKPFVCSVCQRRYRWQGDLKNHMRMAHEGRLAAAKKGGLKKPVRLVRRSISRKCRFGSKRRKKVDSNKPEPQGTKLYCRHCSYVASCRTTLIRHAQVHTEKVAYSCEVCGYATAWKSDVRRHLEKYHAAKYTDESLVNAYIEKIEDTIIDNTIDHERSVEAEITAESVELGDTWEEYTSGALDGSHEAVDALLMVGAENHFDDKVSVTVKTEPISDAESTNEISSQGESRSTASHHDSEWFRVEDIGGSTGKNAERVFKCNLCEYQATRSDYIVNHCTSHQNLRRFKCTICEKRTNCRSDIYNHVKSLHGQEDYEAQTDPMSFVDRLSVEEAQATLQEYLVVHKEDVGGIPIEFGTMPLTPIKSEHDDWRKRRRSRRVQQRLRCSECCMKSSYRWQLTKHFRSSHPGLSSCKILPVDHDDDFQPKLEPVNLTMNSEQAQFISDTAPINDVIKTEESNCHVKGLSAPKVSSRRQVISQNGEVDGSVKLKDSCLLDTLARRYKCSLCSYRANYYSETERHVKRNHPMTRVACVDILPYDEALATLDAYEKAFHGRNKLKTMLANEKDLSFEDIDSLEYQTKISNQESGTLRLETAAPSGVSTANVDQSDTGGERRASSSPRSPRGGARRVWKCPKCDYKHRNHFSVLKHMNQHNNRTNLKNFVCAICFFSTDHHNSIFRHVRTRHSFKGKTKKYVLTRKVAEKRKEDKNMGEPILVEVKKELAVADDKAIGDITGKHEEDDADISEDVGESSATGAPSIDARQTLTTAVRANHVAVEPGGGETAALPESVVAKSDAATTALKCNYCSFNTLWQRVLDTHVSGYHSDVNKKSEVTEMKGFQDHVNCIMTSQGSIFYCEICPFRNKDAALVLAHKKHHIRQKGQNHKCYYCPYFVKHKPMLLRHEQLHRAPQPGTAGTQVQAPNPAGARTDAAKRVNKKADTAFEAAKPASVNHRCATCPYTAKSREELVSHEQFHTPGAGMTYKCSQCDYWVGKKALLLEHQGVHDLSYGASRLAVTNAMIKKNTALTATSSALGCVTSVQAGTRISPSKASTTYDPVLVATVKHDLVLSRITPAPIATLPSDEDLLQIPITGKNATKVDAILHKNRTALYNRKRLIRCRYCPYTHILAGMMERHEGMHGIELQARAIPLEHLMKCSYCDYYASRCYKLKKHAQVHALTYAPDVNDIVDRLELPRGASCQRGAAGQTDVDQSPRYEEMDEDEVPVKHKPPDYEEHSYAIRRDPSPPNAHSAFPYVVKYDTVRREHLVECCLPRKFCCERCPYATTDRAQFQKHIQQHGSKLEFLCQFCDYSVPSAVLLDHHRRLHLKPNSHLLLTQSLNNLQCLPTVPADVAVAMSAKHDVEDPLVDLAGLHGHLDLYENRIPADEVKKKDKNSVSYCNRCPFTTTKECWLHLHMKCHGVKNPYSCPYCDWSCTLQRVLNNHVKMHFQPVASNGKFKPASDVFVKTPLEELTTTKRTPSVKDQNQSNGESRSSAPDGNSAITGTNDECKMAATAQSGVTVPREKDVKQPDAVVKAEHDAAITSAGIGPGTRTSPPSPTSPPFSTLGKSFAEFAASALTLSPDKSVASLRFTAPSATCAAAAPPSASKELVPNNLPSITTETNLKKDDILHRKALQGENSHNLEVVKTAEITPNSPLETKETGMDSKSQAVISGLVASLPSCEKSISSASPAPENDTNPPQSCSKSCEVVHVSGARDSPTDVSTSHDLVSTSHDLVSKIATSTDTAHRTTTTDCPCEPIGRKLNRAAAAAAVTPSDTHVIFIDAPVETVVHVEPLDVVHKLSSDLPVPVSRYGELRPKISDLTSDKNSNSWICPFCDRVFKQAEQLNRHAKQHLIGNYF